MAFTRLLNSIDRSIYRIKAEAMAEFQLKSSHVYCIYYIHLGVANSVSALCKACEEDKSNVSRSLRELEELGLVSCERDARGRRRARYELTDNGKEIGDFLSLQVENILGIVEDTITEDERDIMYSALTRINASLAKLAKEA